MISRLFVKLRMIVVLATVGVTVWLAVALPSIKTTSGGVYALVPKHAPALTAQRISAQRFGFPLLSQTVVVVRNRNGLSQARQAQLTALAERLTAGRVAGFSQVRAALPLANTLAAGPLTREHGTTVLLYLYFRGGLSVGAQADLARRLVSQVIGHRPGEFEGVTSAGPARATGTKVVNSYLNWVELATILVVALAIAVHFRGFGAAVITICAVGMAYLVADRLVGQFGRLAGLGIPAEAQPVLVVLVFGVVTDYSIFFLSRFRALLADGRESRDAAAQVVREITPIVAVAGTTVAAGTAALLVAHLQFLRAFGPGLAVAVAVAMVVAVTFVPAALALAGPLAFWPHQPRRPAGVGAVPSETAKASARRRGGIVRLAVRHPFLAALLACVLVFGAASGLRKMALGNELIVGLPAGSNVHRAYDQAKAGFSPGVLSPAVVVVTGPGVGGQLPRLIRFERLLATQPDVADVMGPREQGLAQANGAMISRTGDAARYLLFLGSDPLSAHAISVIRSLSNRIPALLTQAGLSHSRGLVGGDTALSADTVSATLSDLARVTPAVLVAIFVVISLFLLALVAPAFLVLTSVVAAAASLGLTVYVMQILLGYGQITYYVVFVVAVLLVSLGSDYNVFLVGRVWQEGRRRRLREAVEVAGVRAARPITTAGFVLAISFALLAIVPVRSFREIAFGMAVGLLIDAFVVRTLLVPALFTLVGARSAWPGHVLTDTEDSRPQWQPSESSHS